MQKFLEKNHKFLIVAVFLFAAILIFSGLTRADVQTDEATYSLRALSWFDYMDTSNLQTTPVQWFETIPAWSKLSFHDAPPLVFAIQHVFFKIFGEGILAVRLPFALAGFGSVILLYFLTRQLYDKSTALFASLTLATLSYHSWSSKVGYLEPIATFFIILTLYLFVLSLKNHKRFILFGLSLGLMMLTKYTTFFVIPVIFLYLAVKDRKIFYNKSFWTSLILTLIIISPVIFYNYQMFQTRGHFDVQFSKLLGQDISQDWPGLVQEKNGTNYLVQGLNTWGLTHVISLPLYFLFVVSLIYIIVASFKKESRDKNLFLLLSILFLTLTFSFVGSTVRFLSILNPFIALTISVFLFKIIEKLSSLKPYQFYFLLGLLGVIFCFEVFYNINTNLLENSVGQAGKHYSSYRFERGGFIELEDYLLDNTTVGDSSHQAIRSFNDILITPEKDLKDKDVIVFDPNLRWFSTLWYFRRFAIYDNDLLISASDLSLAVPIDQWQDFFQSVGATNFYYIRGEDDSVFDQGALNSNNQAAANSLKDYILSLGSETVLINNSKDRLVFKIYKLNLN